MRITTRLAALLAITSNGSALAADGEKYSILVSYETQTESENSSSSSRGRTLYSEQIISDSGDCSIKRFDIVDEERRERPLAEWQWPVEVENCGNGDRKILNLPAMEARLSSFLAAAEVPQDKCGRYYFTWNVFKVECDPQAILSNIETIDLGSLTLVEGAEYVRSGTPDSTLLRKVTAEDGKTKLKAVFAIDPSQFREETAQSQVIVQELTGEAISYEEALAEAQVIEVAGSTTIEFEIASDRSEITQTTVTTATIDEPGEGRETQASKVTILRKRAAQ